MNNRNKYQIAKRAFLNDLFDLFDAYNVTISHQDAPDGLLLKFGGTEASNQDDMDWLTDASVIIPDKPESGE